MRTCAIFTTLLLLSFGAMRPNIARAQWSGSGVLLYTEADSPAICPDGAGGAFIAWRDGRASYDIYLQHLDHAGRTVPGWPTTGLALVVEPHVQEAPIVASDGFGGVFVCWYDESIFAFPRTFVTHVNASGQFFPGWPVNGLNFMPASSSFYPQVFADGIGGAYIFFGDTRDNTGDNEVSIYGQHLTATGGLAPGWPATGKPVANCPVMDREFFRAVRDSNGGFLFAWSEPLQAATNPIYAQHIDSDGNVAAGWAACGNIVTPPQAPTSGLFTESLVPTSGGAIVIVSSPGSGHRGGDFNSSTLGIDRNGGLLPPWSAGLKVFLAAPGDQSDGRDVGVSPFFGPPLMTGFPA